MYRFDLQVVSTNQENVEIMSHFAHTLAPLPFAFCPLLCLSPVVILKEPSDWTLDSSESQTTVQLQKVTDGPVCVLTPSYKDVCTSLLNGMTSSPSEMHSSCGMIG
jgi:hypothetical protein